MCQEMSVLTGPEDVRGDAIASDVTDLHVTDLDGAAVNSACQRAELAAWLRALSSCSQCGVSRRVRVV